MDLRSVTESNRALLKRARDLNIRAGAEVFPALKREEYKEFLAQCLGGARRVAEVADPTILLLPSLDEDLVALVVDDNPDVISVLDREVPVEYRQAGPLVRMDFRGDESRDWLKLPDAGIYLPGGREVSMYAAIKGYHYYIETTSSQFKVKARECLNQGLWEGWQRPELPAPMDSVPPIVEAEYGRCVVTDRPLVAYGAIQAYQFWSSDQVSWKSYWSRDRAEAEETRAKAVQKLEEIQAEALQKREYEEAHQRAEQARTQLLDWSSHQFWGDLDPALRGKVDAWRYSNLPSSTEGLRQLAAEIEAFIVEIEAELMQFTSLYEQQGADLPGGLKEIFGSLAQAVVFWEKVKKLQGHQLDDHILYGCGRNRRCAHLVEVSGDPDFFCGADPNKVAVYVADYHMGKVGDLEDGIVEHKAPNISPPPTQKAPTNIQDALSALKDQWGC